MCKFGRFGALGLVLVLFSWAGLAAASTEELTIVTGYNGIKLTGRWMLPDSGVRGVALIIQGSGNVDLDGEVSSPFVGRPHQAASAKLSLQLAQALSTKGIASLRYNKRGFEDPAQLPSQITSILSKDARAVAEQARSRFPGTKFGLVGFSEGATVAVLVGNEIAVDALFLVGLATRAVDEMFRYQFLQWPLDLMRERLHASREGEIALGEFKAKAIEKPIFGDLLPALNKPVAEFDLNHDGKISVEGEFKPAYEEGLAQVMAMLRGPGFAGWYKDLKSLPPMREILGTLKSQVAFLYNALDDAQMSAKWIDEDLHYFPGHATTHKYAGVGHCFSPMEGTIGQVKTSGPMSDELLSGLAGDFETVVR
ncbi:MAG: hypothetical protein HY074_19380 [Deltaproteobacteria bacterium]|nr:hypothetical protein [Deltaproteobacteria bacterium]